MAAAACCIAQGPDEAATPLRQRRHFGLTASSSHANERRERRGVLGRRTLVSPSFAGRCGFWVASVPASYKYAEVERRAPLSPALPRTGVTITLHEKGFCSHRPRKDHSLPQMPWSLPTTGPASMTRRARNRSCLAFSTSIPHPNGSIPAIGARHPSLFPYHRRPSLIT